MNIYIIGNGFDLDLGYDTSYKSFLLSDEFKILIQNNSDNNLAKFIHKYQNHDYDNDNENWVDVEVILGNYVDQVCGDEAEVLSNHYKELKNHLKKYLTSLKNKFSVTDQSNTRAFIFLREIINDINEKKDSVIVNFNFTNTVLPRLNFIYGTSIDRKYLNYLHPHGTLSTDIAFGVNEGFLNAQSNKYSFIKKAYSENYNLRGWENIFKKANKISIFGHSLGITDIDIIGPMFKYFLNNPDENRDIHIYDQKSANQIVTNRVDKLIDGKIGTFKISNNLYINSY